MSASIKVPPTSQQLQALLDKLRHQQFMEQFMQPPGRECEPHDAGKIAAEPSGGRSPRQ